MRLAQDDEVIDIFAPDRAATARRKQSRADIPLRVRRFLQLNKSGRGFRYTQGHSTGAGLKAVGFPAKKAPCRGDGASRCPFRKSYPDVLMVQSSQDGNRGNVARALDHSMHRRVFT
jgi:hypothetical protein